MKSTRSKVLAVLAVIVAILVLGYGQLGQDATRTNPKPTHSRTTIPKGVLAQAFSPADNLPCVADNATKAKLTWNEPTSGGLVNADARARQGNTTSTDQDLVYEFARTQVGLIVQAIACDDDALLRSIGEAWTPVLSSRLHYQPPIGPQFDTWLVTTPTGNPATIYYTGENFAYMYVMLWNMATILGYITTITPASRTAWQTAFVTRWAPVLRDHYQHQMYTSTWLYAADWAGPCEGPHNIAVYGTSTTGKIQQLVRMSAKDWGSAVQDKDGCNHIRDAELYIHTGFAEFTRAHLNDPTNVPIAGTDMTDANMKQINSLTNKFIRDQSITTSLTNFVGGAKTGRLLYPYTFKYRPNPNVPGTYWGLITENGWAGDVDESLPPAPPGSTSTSVCPYRPINTPAGPLGSDTSHDNIFPLMLLSLRSLNGFSGMTDQITTVEMAQFANQIAYAVSNKNTTYPRFTNFLSGVNGWYRTQYGSSVLAGYAPWESGTQGAVIGAFWWGTYNQDLANMAVRWKAIWEATSGADYTWRVANLSAGGGKWSLTCTYNASSTLNVAVGNPYGSGMFYPSLAPYVSDGGTPATTTTTTTTTIAPTTTTTTTTPPPSNDACPSGTVCLFPANPAPSAISAGDSVTDNFGVKMTFAVAGQITAIRYYRPGGDTTTRTARVYNPAGTVLVSATTSVTTQGWRTITLATPLSVSTGIVYTIAVDSPTTAYPYTYDVFLTGPVINGSITGPQSAASPDENGVYGSGTARPNNSYRATSYSVDVAWVAGAVTTTTTIAPTTTTTTIAGIYYPVKCVRTPRRTVICTQNGRVISTTR